MRVVVTNLPTGESIEFDVCDGTDIEMLLSKLLSEGIYKVEIDGSFYKYKVVGSHGMAV